MQDLLIIGAGGYCSQVIDIVRQAGHLRPVAVLDSNHSLHGSSVDGVSVLGGLEMLPRIRSRTLQLALVAVGDNLERVQIAMQIAKAGWTLASAVHPSASIARSAQVGQHVVIGPRAIVCVHAKIGNHVVIGSGAIVEHDVELGDGVFLQPAVRLAGAVTVGAGAMLGIGASVIPMRRVARGVVVEPGAVVIEDLADGVIAGGVPAAPHEPTSRFTPESIGPK